MMNLKGYVNWRGIVGGISLFLLIAFSTIVGHWIADYLDGSLKEDVALLKKQHKLLCSQYGVDCEAKARGKITRD